MDFQKVFVHFSSNMALTKMLIQSIFHDNGKWARCAPQFGAFIAGTQEYLTRDKYETDLHLFYKNFVLTIIRIIFIGIIARLRFAAKIFCLDFLDSFEEFFGLLNLLDFNFPIFRFVGFYWFINILSCRRKWLFELLLVVKFTTLSESCGFLCTIFRTIWFCRILPNF